MSLKDDNEEYCIKLQNQSEKIQVWWYKKYSVENIINKYGKYGNEVLWCKTMIKESNDKVSDGDETDIEQEDWSVLMKNEPRLPA